MPHPLVRRMETPSELKSSNQDLFTFLELRAVDDAVTQITDMCIKNDDVWGEIPYSQFKELWDRNSLGYHEKSSEAVLGKLTAGGFITMENGMIKITPAFIDKFATADATRPEEEWEK